MAVNRWLYVISNASYITDLRHCNESVSALVTFGVCEVSGVVTINSSDFVMVVLFWNQSHYYYCLLQTWLRKLNKLC